MKPYVFLPFLIQSTFWWVVVKPLTVVFTGLKIYDTEHIKNLDGPVIFAPNHLSSFDPVLFPLALPFWSKFSPIFYVVREGKHYTSWKKFLFSFFNLELIGAFAIGYNKKDYAASLIRHTKLLEDGHSVCIFPEGRIGREGKILEGHGGVAYLARATKKPVVPVLISGISGISFRKFFMRELHVTVQFFPPMYFNDDSVTLTGEQYKADAEKILNVLREARGEPIVPV